jgi:hypothetical protein
VRYIQDIRRALQVLLSGLDRQLFKNGISNFTGGSLTTNIRGTNSCGSHGSDRSPQVIGSLWPIEPIEQHHHTVESCGWIGNSASGNVGCCTVYRFKECPILTKVAAGGNTQTTAVNAGNIRQNIAKQVGIL